MTNYDIYKDEILKLAEERYSDFYAAEAFAAHDISGLADADNVIKWLFNEYEPPLLKNGDDLKPGDWIMVRDGDSEFWLRRQFMCYYEGKFQCVCYGGKIGGCDEYVGWLQARLPMEGE